MADRPVRTARAWRKAARVTALAALATCVIAPAVWPPRPLLVWNPSPSAPVGLYAISSPGSARAGDMVIARVPADWRVLAGTRRYIPVNVPLVKRVAARSGDSVCALGNRILVNGKLRAQRWGRDSLGRALPWWTGCVTLREGDLFLLMDNALSFDGRYFGLTRREDIIGKARFLWAG